MQRPNSVCVPVVFEMLPRTDFKVLVGLFW